MSRVIPCKRMGSKNVIRTATESLLEYQTAPQMWVTVLSLAEIELSCKWSEIWPRQHFIISNVVLSYF